MTDSPGARLEELFVRYWDNTLSPNEAAALAHLLATDPAARDGFQFLCAQAVAVAELPAVAPNSGKPGGTGGRNWSRRRVLGLGAGLAAGVGGVAFGAWVWGTRASGARLTVVQGAVTVRTADGRYVPAQGRVPTGGTVSTQGVGALAVLTLPNGSTVSLLGDSALTVGAGGRELRLHQGTANANLHPVENAADGVRLTTALVTLAAAGGTVVTLGQGERSTEVEVHSGRASVAAPSGEPLAVVPGGQLLTVGANGATRQEPVRPPADEFAWNLADPLPSGWQVGRRDAEGDVPVVRPALWPDPYYDHAILFQIRSNHQWTRGLFTVSDESALVVRYRARLAAPRGQVCVCVRTPHAHSSDTGMLEYNGGFEATGGEWRT
ncbi:MAG TPA: FecR domain-containing protein, partial [Gemmata sp.]